MHDQRTGTAFKPRAQSRKQRIERGRVVEIIGAVGELECPRIDQMHALKRRPDLVGLLDMRDVG